MGGGALSAPLVDIVVVTVYGWVFVIPPKNYIYNEGLLNLQNCAFGGHEKFGPLNIQLADKICYFLLNLLKGEKNFPKKIEF